MAAAAGKFCMVFVTVPTREVAKAIAGGELVLFVVIINLSLLVS